MGRLLYYSIAPFCPARGTPAASKKYNIAPATSSCRDNVYCKYNIIVSLHPILLRYTRLFDDQTVVVEWLYVFDADGRVAVGWL